MPVMLNGPPTKLVPISVSTIYMLSIVSVTLLAPSNDLKLFV